MDASHARAMSEDAQSLEWLILEFGDQFGPEIFETIRSEYEELFQGLKTSFRYKTSVKQIVLDILSCIEQGDGTIDRDRIIRKFYIKLFLSNYYKSLPLKETAEGRLKKNIDIIRKKLFNIILKSIQNTEPKSWLCDNIDIFISNHKLFIPEPPQTIFDEAAESAQLAVTGKVPVQIRREMTFGRTSTFPSVFREEEPSKLKSLDEEKELREQIREAILDVEGKFNLNDRSTHKLVLTEILHMPRFISIISEDTAENKAKFDEISEIFYTDIELLLTERKSMQVSHSNGGNKKIKSKKNSKRYSKSKKYSKKHSTRRRRRRNS
jgi:hypothetical protein